MSPPLPPGVVLALDHSKVALSRTRCLYEASMALRLKGKTGFRVAIPGQCTAEWGWFTIRMVVSSMRLKDS